MEYSPEEIDVKGEGAGFLIDMNSLYDFLSRLTDRRDAHGIRYKLVHVLVFALLAKLAGEDRLTGISEWVWHRKEALAKVLDLSRTQAPHRSTYSRILGKVIDVEEFEGVMRDFFASAVGGGLEDGRWVQVNIDGKTLRGSISAGQTRGVHLLAAYVPGEHLVLAQVEVDGKENEIKAAPRLLESIDLRGKVVSGDAMLAQRELSMQIVDEGGQYVWTVKDNQPQLRDDIATLFEDGPSGSDFSTADRPAITEAITIGKEHGRLERRTLRASADLKDYLDWPGAQQVFAVERQVERIKDGRVARQVSYGVTSLGPHQASPRLLLKMVRTHWQIENGLHYRRDETLREDWCHLRTGHAQRMMAAINNMVLGLILRRGVRNVPRARRRYAAHWNEALKLIISV